MKHMKHEYKQKDALLREHKESIAIAHQNRKLKRIYNIIATQNNLKWYIVSEMNKVEDIIDNSINYN